MCRTLSGHLKSCLLLVVSGNGLFIFLWQFLGNHALHIVDAPAVSDVEVPFQSVPCPENARPAYPDGTCWFPVRHPRTRHYWDEQCKWGMKGCWADGATWRD